MNAQTAAHAAEIERLCARAKELEAELATEREVRAAAQQSQRNLYHYAICDTPENFAQPMYGVDSLIRNEIKWLRKALLRQQQSHESLAIMLASSDKITASGFAAAQRQCERFAKESGDTIDPAQEPAPADAAPEPKPAAPIEVTPDTGQPGVAFDFVLPFTLPQRDINRLCRRCEAAIREAFEAGFAVGYLDEPGEGPTYTGDLRRAWREGRKVGGVERSKRAKVGP